MLAPELPPFRNRRGQFVQLPFERLDTLLLPLQIIGLRPQSSLL